MYTTVAEVVNAKYILEMSGKYFNPIPSHSQWSIPIPIPTPMISLVFIPIPIPFPLVIPIPSHAYSRTTTADTNKYVLPSVKIIW